MGDGSGKCGERGQERVGEEKNKELCASGSGWPCEQQVEEIQRKPRAGSPNYRERRSPHHNKCWEETTPWCPLWERSLIELCKNSLWVRVAAVAPEDSLKGKLSKEKSNLVLPGNFQMNTGLILTPFTDTHWVPKLPPSITCLAFSRLLFPIHHKLTLYDCITSARFLLPPTLWHWCKFCLLLLGKHLSKSAGFLFPYKLRLQGKDSLKTASPTVVQPHSGHSSLP